MVHKKSKLRTYCLFKETIKNYIKYNLSSSERSAMAQFRFGILPLNIETGRFRNQGLDERLCTLCAFNETEDESHFLFQCSLYDEVRSEWVSHIVNKTVNFLELDKINKFKVILDIILDIHHRITAKFILRCYQLRKEVYTVYNVLCAHLSCICITCVHRNSFTISGVHYSVLVKIVCSIHVFALYVDIESVLLLLCSLTFVHVLE